MQFERLFFIMTKPWVVFCCIGFIIFSILYIDQPIAYYFHALQYGGSLTPLIWLTKLGLSMLYIVPVFMLALVFRYIYHHKVWEMRAWFLWLCVLIPNGICLILKVGLGRARPGLLFINQQYGFYGFETHADYWSFPSGHTTTIMGFVFGLCALFPNYTIIYILLGLTVIISRVMLTQHYLSDVLVASYLALIEVGLLYHWFRRRIGVTSQ